MVGLQANANLQCLMLHMPNLPTGSSMDDHLRQGLKESADTEEDMFWEGGVSEGWLTVDASLYLVLSSLTSA